MNKIIIFGFIFTLFNISCYAEAISYKEQSCQQTFTHVNVGGDVIMNCITYINQQSSVEEKIIESLTNRLKDVNLSVQSLKAKNENISYQISINKNDLESLENNISIHKANLDNFTKSLKEIANRLKNNEIVQDEIKNQLNNKIALIQEKNTIIINTIKKDEALINALQNDITLIEERLCLVETKIDVAETNIAILMKVYKEGTLTDLYFIGVKTGIATTVIQNTKYPYLGIEFEGLLPRKYNASLYGEALFFSGKKESQYATLNGIEKSTKSEQDTIVSLGIGGRWFFLKDTIDSSEKNYYLGASFGKTFKDEKSFYSSIFAGKEYYMKNIKLSLELGSVYFADRTYEEVIFNPLGESKIEDKVEQFTIYFSVRLAIRAKL